MFDEPLTPTDILSLPAEDELQPDNIGSVELDRLVNYARAANEAKIYQEKLSAQAEMLLVGDL